MMKTRSLRSTLVAALLGVAFVSFSATSALALSFTVHGYDRGERIELSDGRRVWTAELDVTLGDQHGTAFCVDVHTQISVGTYTPRSILDAYSDASPVDEIPRDFAWAGHVMTRFGTDLDALVGTGVTRDQAITGVQAAIWEGIYEGKTVNEDSLSSGARRIFEQIMETEVGDLGSPVIVELVGHQDQVFSNPVPEPTAALVFGAGLLVVQASLRRR